MQPTPDPIPGVTDDPVIRLLLSGKARTLHEAEEKYLDSAMPEILDLLRSPLTDEELARHPLLQMIRDTRQSRLGGLDPVNPDARLAEIVAALEAVGRVA